MTFEVGEKLKFNDDHSVDFDGLVNLLTTQTSV